MWSCVGYPADILFLQDLAKQGVRISCIIQVALACLSGAILPILFWLINLRSWHYLKARIPLMQRFRQKFWKTNAFFSMILLFVICIRYRYSKNLPALEIAYLSKLLTLEEIVTMTLICGQTVDTSINGQKSNRQKSNLRVLPYFPIFYAQLAAICSINIPNRAAYLAMAKECYKQDYFMDTTSQLHTGDGRGVLKGTLVSVCIFIGVHIIVAILAQVTVVKKAWNKMVPGWEVPAWIAPGWVKKYGITILDVSNMGIWTLNTVSNLEITEKGRKMVLKSIGGENGDQEEAQDFPWDYAQTMAILIWFPVLWSALTMIKNWNQEEILKSLAGNVARPPPPPYGQTDIRDFMLKSDLKQAGLADLRTAE